MARALNQGGLMAVAIDRSWGIDQCWGKNRGFREPFNPEDDQ